MNRGKNNPRRAEAGYATETVAERQRRLEEEMKSLQMADRRVLAWLLVLLALVAIVTAFSALTAR